jgi:flagellar protein FlgJ
MTVSTRGLSSVGSQPATAKPPEKPETVQKAAKDFEALLIEQMLRSAREAGSGDWMGGGEDQTGMPLGEMAEQQFAQMLSSNGGLGLAKLVVDGLRRR